MYRRESCGRVFGGFEVPGQRPRHGAFAKAAAATSPRRTRSAQRTTRVLVGTSSETSVSSAARVLAWAAVRIPGAQVPARGRLASACVLLALGAAAGLGSA